ncbi:MAG: helix-turn-helix transcriptional regulator [Sneathiellaceae bacterium]|jgi:DNA-binding CsgD family transcriptional regulator
MKHRTAKDGPAGPAKTRAAADGLDVTQDNVAVVLDTVRHARRLAASAAASFYGLYVETRDRRIPGLATVFDREFPRTSDLSRAICGPAGMAWMATRTESLAPAWWYCETGAQQCPAFPLVSLGHNMPALTSNLPGMALPVFAEGGIGGFFVLAGRDMAVDDGLVCDLHIRAFSLFRSVARLRLSQLDGTPPMSKRELECLTMTAEGKTSEDIAAALGLSVHTTNQYLAATTHKLNAMSRTHAVAKALRLGLIA